jgi:glycosyltransferase involved in cell wall biosynthesis
VISIGLPVRNGREFVERCIESILAQDFADLELVVCDNASDDGTTDILAAYARADRRIRFSRNPVNIGLYGNVYRVFELSRGAFFRWISADDWLEPGCLSACVKALTARPEAIGATTWFTIYTPHGEARYEEFRGEFPTSADPARRFERMLWFYHAGDAKYDPIYGVYRRQYLTRAPLQLPSEQNDWLVAAALSLMGPIINVPERLANRTRPPEAGIKRTAVRQRLDPVRWEQLRTSPQRTYRELRDLVISARLTEPQLRRCRAALRRFWIKETIRVARSSLGEARRRLVAS